MHPVKLFIVFATLQSFAFHSEAKIWLFINVTPNDFLLWHTLVILRNSSYSSQINVSDVFNSTEKRIFAHGGTNIKHIRWRILSSHSTEGRYFDCKYATKFLSFQWASDWLLKFRYNASLAVQTLHNYEHPGEAMETYWNTFRGVTVNC